MLLRVHAGIPSEGLLLLLLLALLSLLLLLSLVRHWEIA